MLRFGDVVKFNEDIDVNGTFVSKGFELMVVAVSDDGYLLRSTSYSIKIELDNLESQFLVEMGFLDLKRTKLRRVK